MSQFRPGIEIAVRLVVELGLELRLGQIGLIEGVGQIVGLVERLVIELRLVIIIPLVGKERQRDAQGKR